jgi:hypothetical protein
VGRPRIVTDVIRNYACWIGKQPIVPTHLEVAAPDVESFVDSELLNPDRQLPIMLISHDRFSDRPPIDPGVLQEKLLGLSQVVVMDKWACFRLTDMLSKPLSCYNGALRIYWPGLRSDANPLDHPLYLPGTIEKYQYTGRPLERQLFGLLSRISTFRFDEGPVAREVRRRVASARVVEVRRARDVIQQGITSTTAENERLKKENSELRDLYDLAEMEKEELHRELEEQRANWQVVRSFQQATEIPSDASTQAEPEAEFSSVSEALKKAEADFAKKVVFYEACRRSAKKSYFARPDQVYRVFEAIAEVAEEYFNARKKGHSMGRLEDAFVKRGFTDYSPKESKQTMDLYGDQRRFTHKGKQREMQKHLTLGGGDRTNCVQIYFEAEEKGEVFEIGYCGPHLDYKSQTT